MKLRTRVSGMKEGSAAVVEIAQAVPKLLGQALRDPMRERVLADAKALVPRRTGELYDALDVTPVRQLGGNMTDRLAAVGLRIKRMPKGKIGVGTGGGDLRPRSYWHLVEFGTAHSPAHPFIRPAFDRNAAQLVEDFKRIVAAGLERVTKRARRGAVGQYAGNGDD